MFFMSFIVFEIVWGKGDGFLFRFCGSEDILMLDFNVSSMGVVFYI